MILRLSLDNYLSFPSFVPIDTLGKYFPLNSIRSLQNYISFIRIKICKGSLTNLNQEFYMKFSHYLTPNRETNLQKKVKMKPE